MAKRKAFGLSKKKLSDFHHQKKQKMESSSKSASSGEGFKHSRIDTRNI